MPLVVENRDEMYGGCDGKSFYPWMAGISMDGGIHRWHATRAFCRLLPSKRHLNPFASQLIHHLEPYLPNDRAPIES